MLLAWWLAAAALGLGGALGVRAFFDPKWALRLVRAPPDAQGGGEAEFRAFYGAALAASHIVALLLTLRYLLTGHYLIGVVATGALAVLAAAWGGAAVGRFAAFWRDGARTRFNLYRAFAETGLAIAIGLPWVLWMLA